jgi:hypothetical protein
VLIQACSHWKGDVVPHRRKGATVRRPLWRTPLWAMHMTVTLWIMRRRGVVTPALLLLRPLLVLMLVMTLRLMPGIRARVAYPSRAATLPPPRWRGAAVLRLLLRRLLPPP